MQITAASIQDFTLALVHSVLADRTDPLMSRDKSTAAKEMITRLITKVTWQTFVNFQFPFLGETIRRD